MHSFTRFKRVCPPETKPVIQYQYHLPSELYSACFVMQWKHELTWILEKKKQWPHTRERMPCFQPSCPKCSRTRLLKTEKGRHKRYLVRSRSLHYGAEQFDSKTSKIAWARGWSARAVRAVRSNRMNKRFKRTSEWLSASEILVDLSHRALTPKLSRKRQTKIHITVFFAHKANLQRRLPLCLWRTLWTRQSAAKGMSDSECWSPFPRTDTNPARARCKRDLFP